MSSQEFHYYAASGLCWAVASTREGAIRKVARDAGARTLAQQVKHNGGLLCYTVKVNLPQLAEYRLDNYMPDGVPTEDRQNFRIQNVAGEVVPA